MSRKWDVMYIRRRKKNFQRRSKGAYSFQIPFLTPLFPLLSSPCSLLSKILYARKASYPSACLTLNVSLRNTIEMKFVTRAIRRIRRAAPLFEKKKVFQPRLASTKLSARRKFEALRRSTAQADPLLSWNGSVAVRPNHTPARASSINTFQFVVPEIRPDPSGGFFDITRDNKRKNEEGILEKILSPRSNTRCR